MDGLGDRFARVFSSISDYDQLKSPRFYGRVCQEMGVKPYEMIHVGDSERFDFTAAKEAGVRAFHLKRNQESGDAEALNSLTELEIMVQSLSKSAWPGICPP